MDTYNSAAKHTYESKVKKAQDRKEEEEFGTSGTNEAMNAAECTTQASHREARLMAASASISSNETVYKSLGIMLPVSQLAVDIRKWSQRRCFGWIKALLALPQRNAA
jgi:hypothetical protein